ncbi:hypothetical protein [Acinetobacter bereziniae]|uniref:hypothetical protein n=1 Tax=Acinetobacter bereziniae TaxID=106648 RepID=UPI00125053E7|nr:hypothetical protein [Acinetobacter bereziniae]
MKYKVNTIQGLLNEIETNLKSFLDSCGINANSIEMSDYNSSSINLSWLIKFSEIILPTYNNKIRELFVFEDENFNNIFFNKLHRINGYLVTDRDEEVNENNRYIISSHGERLNLIYNECIDFIWFFENTKIINFYNSKINLLNNDVDLINKVVDDRSEKEQVDKKLFDFFLKNIDILLMLERVFKIINNKLSFCNIESEFEKDLKDRVKHILKIFNDDKNNKVLLGVDFTNFNIVDKFSIDVDEYFDEDVEGLIKNEETLNFIVNIIKSIESNLLNCESEKYHNNNNYIYALRLYDLEKKLLNKSIEVNELELKFNGLSMIDKNLTNKNEFYDKKIAKLIKLEKCFSTILDYYNQLSVNDFTGKEWSQINKIKSNIEYIVYVFKQKNTYKFFLLLDDSYIDVLIKFFDFKQIDDESVKWEDEISQELIVDFHKKAENPDSFIQLKHEDWNTPLFRFNTNHYYLIKDYESKIENLKSNTFRIKEVLEEENKNIDNFLVESSKRIEDQLIINYETIIKLMKENIEKNNIEIEKNGGLNLKVEEYVNKLKECNEKYYTQATNVLSSNKIVKGIVDDIRESKSFIDEIKGLYINNETRKVYETVFFEELKIANNFRLVSLFIYGFLGFFAFISLLILLFDSSNSIFINRLTDINTLLIKLSFIFTLVFIGVYLSREGEKHRRIANQARQTMNELHAFSSYSTDIKDKIPEIKTKLADKYFGKTLYETEKAMIPDSDVLKSVIDQTKATTDLVKAFKGTVTPATSSPESPKNQTGNG